MPSMRVHELAKEFGMNSQELLGHLQRLKIPAKGHSSSLVEAYVDKIRKDLGPVIAEKQAELEAIRLQQLEEERRLAEELEAKAQAEAVERANREAAARAEREAAEASLKAEREAEEANARAAAEAFQAEQEAAANERAEQEKRDAEEAARLDREEAERYRAMAEQAQAQTAIKTAHDRVIQEAKDAVAAAARDGKKKKKKQKRHEVTATATEDSTPVEVVSAGKADGALTVTEGATVGELAALLDTSTSEIIKRLMLLGTMLTVNQPMPRDVMELVAEDLGRTLNIVRLEEETVLTFTDAPEDLIPRPPVVTVMGHVDHGKTSLLDAIRETGVAQTEAGGITQHIGASVVTHKDQRITFIDTPGHEAFTAMRARGAKVTDIAILVVAADDGVMPQTVEAIHHAKAAKVPIIIAVNKIDKDGANPDQVRQILTEHEIVPEEWGGNNIFVDVSAKKRINIDELLETILLVAEVEELRANPEAPASGVVIEAKLDKGRGPVATVLVQRGTLRVGDSLVAGSTYGRVRALVDPKGATISSAGPADPVEVLGLGSVPSAGDEFRVFADERDSKNLAEERALKLRLLAQDKKLHVSLDDLFARIQEGNLRELNLVVKADVHGSIEALKDALDKMDQSEVKISVIHSAVGGITETDVMLADASDAIIIGFNVRPEPKAKALAEKESVDLRMYRVIYQAIEDINAARVGMLAPDVVETDTAQVEVRELFRVPKIGVIAGCYVLDGEISRDDRIRIVREGLIVYEGKVGSLRRFKEDVKSVRGGYECGISIDGYQDLKQGDLIEGFKISEVARTE